MAVHPFVPGLLPNLLLVVTGIIFFAGLFVLFARWGHRSPGRFVSSWLTESFRDGGMAFLRVLVWEVLLFRRIWRRSRRRWALHMAMFWGFVILGAFTIISIIGLTFGYLDPTGPGGAFSQYLAGIRLPYDLLGYLILAAATVALVRRIFVKSVRERSRFTDWFLVGSVFVIALTGMIAEWLSGFATGIGPLFENYNLSLEFMAWHIYAAFLLFVMVIPWTKFRHIITVPLTLLARRGGE